MPLGVGFRMKVISIGFLQLTLFMFVYIGHFIFLFKSHIYFMILTILDCSYTMTMLLIIICYSHVMILYMLTSYTQLSSLHSMACAHLKLLRNS